MLTRKKSLRQYCAEKRARTAKEGPLAKPAPRSGPWPQTRNGAIQRSKAPMKRTPLRKVSAKRAAEAKEYSKLRTKFLAEHRLCQACIILHPVANIQARSVDVHHRFGRAGSNFLDISTWSAVCRDCHDELHAAPNKARELGFIAPRGA